jgi:hypothetical protein
VPPVTSWRHFLDTDEKRFGGKGRIRRAGVYLPIKVHDRGRNEIVDQIQLYLPARTAVVLKRRIRV